MPKLLLAANYSRRAHGRSTHGFEIGSRRESGLLWKGRRGLIPLRGLSLFVQVEEKTDSRSSLLFARPQVYGCSSGIPVVPADPPVIISANDEGVILEVDLSFTVARDALETSVFCYFLYT